MLEERVVTNMDKKPGARTSSIPPRASGTDSKKNDNGTSNKYTRYPKKKEGNGNKPFQDNVGRRPNPQRARVTPDKRPRFKGFYPDRPRNDVAEDICPELGSAVNYGSKKANLNHLLNFTLAPREPQRGWNIGARQRNRSRTFYNKERFLQANCQFVVRETGDYAIHNIDPDKLVDWDSVEQVRVSSHELPSCPICLQHPLAAKMTRCGHIYCWACILHYLALGEKTWRKCPICYESVHSKDMKSVLTQKMPHYKVGESITMKLMKKEKGCTYALPLNIWRKSDQELSNVEDPPDVTIHKKLLLASPAQINKLVIEPEKAELQKQLTEAESSEVAFIESALEAINERQQKLFGLTKAKKEVDRMLEAMKSLPEDKPDVKTVETVVSDKKIKRYASAFSDEEEEEILETPTSPLHVVASCPEFGSVSSCSESPDESLTDTADSEGAKGYLDSPSPQTGKQVTSDVDRPNCLPVDEAAESLELPESDTERRVRKSSSNAYYFFQVSDGQPIFINALNAHCLVKEYGSLENCPETITANIVEMEHVFMSEELRRRLRYLSHLPLSSEFEVVELILRPPVISKETIKHFSARIDHHRRMRQKKNREEKKWTRKVEAEESRKLGIASDFVIVKSQFNQATNEISPVTSTVNTPESSPSVIADDVPLSPGSDDGQQTTNISFAQMLKGGKAKAPLWPKSGKPDTGDQRSDVNPRSQGADSDSDSEDRVPVPTYQSSMGDAIEAAFVTLAKSKDYSEIQSPEKSSGKKKKKQKQTLLFATSMARGGK